MILSARDLAGIRGDLSSLLPGTCNILSLTRSKSGTGGGTITWGTAYAGVACDVWRSGGRREAPLNDELVAASEFTFGMPYDTTVTEANRVEYEGSVFQVLGVDDTLPDQLQIRVYTRRSESDE